MTRPICFALLLPIVAVALPAGVPAAPPVSSRADGVRLAAERKAAEEQIGRLQLEMLVADIVAQDRAAPRADRRAHLTLATLRR